MKFEEKAEDALDAVLHASCFGDGCNFDLDDRARLISSIASALQEAYEQGRRSEMDYGRQLAALSARNPL